MATFTGQTVCSVQIGYLGSNDLSTLIQNLAQSFSQSWTSGTGNNQCNALFADTRTAAGATDSLDLYGGLTDAYGTTLNFTKIRGVLVRNQATTTAFVLKLAGSFMTGPVLNGTTPELEVNPSGIWYQTNPIDGWTVTNTTQDVLSVNPGANTIIYDIIIMGTV
jgi:hypothetical protein